MMADEPTVERLAAEIAASAMSKPSRQFEQLQRASLARLAARIPDGCPIAVRRNPAGAGFLLAPAGQPDTCALRVGRFEVVAAFIDGYVSAWVLFA